MKARKIKDSIYWIGSMDLGRASVRFTWPSSGRKES